MTKFTNNNKNKKVSHRKKFLLLSIALVVSALAVLLALEQTNVIDLYSKGTDVPATVDTHPNTEIDYNPATPTDNNDIEARKNSGEIDSQPGTPTNDTAIQITFIASGQDNSGGPLVVRTLLGGATGGTCKLDLVGSTNISKSSTIIRQNTTFSCEGFEVPFSELSAGEWQIKLTVLSEDGRQNVATTSANIN